MSRFKLPPRVAPSPAAGEPGLQNAAARLRSSRDAQARLLEERRAREALGEPENTAAVSADEGCPTATFTATSTAELLLETASTSAVHKSSSGPIENLRKKPGKEKLVVLFRLPLATAKQATAIQGARELGEAYVLKALAKKGRAELRALENATDLTPWSRGAADFRIMSSAQLTLGESMTVYLHQKALSAMHDALGDPWRVLPKATVVGAYLAAIVTRLIEARLAK